MAMATSSTLVIVDFKNHYCVFDRTKTMEENRIIQLYAVSGRAYKAVKFQMQDHMEVMHDMAHGFDGKCVPSGLGFIFEIQEAHVWCNKGSCKDCINFKKEGMVIVCYDAFTELSQGKIWFIDSDVLDKYEQKVKKKMKDTKDLKIKVCGNINCFNTKKNFGLLGCKGCGKFWYCSKLCQKTHWKMIHKQACDKLHYID